MSKEQLMQPISGTALVVEDDTKIRKLVRGCLERIGLKVVDVGDGRSAIRKLTEQPPDIVCLDLMLPELSGFEICEIIRASATLKHIPVLVMSARALPSDRAHAEEAGASAYLIKPFSIAELSGKVRSLLKATSTLEANLP
jgi:two-component system chemotaxis response regulator CheY